MNKEQEESLSAQGRDKSFWAQEIPHPGGPNDEDVKTYLKYRVEGTTLLLGATKKLIQHTDKQMDIDPQYQEDTMIIGDWRDNTIFYDNMLGDGVINFTKELEIGLLEMASKHCKRLIVRGFNYKYNWMRIAANFPNSEELHIKPTFVEVHKDYTFFIWDFQNK